MRMSGDVYGVGGSCAVCCVLRGVCTRTRGVVAWRSVVESEEAAAALDGCIGACRSFHLSDSCGLWVAGAT